MARPFANLFAVLSQDPQYLGDIERKMTGSGLFAEVWRPAKGWVAGCAPLPRSDPEPGFIRDAGFAFAEGRDRIFTGNEERDRVTLDRLRATVDESPERLATFPGDFGFIRFRDDGGMAVSPCVGVAQFYSARTSVGKAFGTRLGDFARFLGYRELDPLPNAVWTTGHGFFPDRRTFLTGVTALPRGSFATTDSTTPTTYWDARPTTVRLPSDDEAREHADRLKDLLIAALKRDLDPGGGNLLTLSGGVDSSALALLAAGELNYELWSLSIVPDREPARAREIAFIDAVEQEVGITKHWRVEPEADKHIEGILSFPPVLFPVPHPALCALPQIAEGNRVNVLLGGEFADDICGSFRTLPDWTRHVRARDLLDPRRLPRGRADFPILLRQRVRAALRRPSLPVPKRLPPWIRPELASEYSAWQDREHKRAQSDSRPWRYFAESVASDGWMAMNWEALSTLGIRRSAPFYSREAVELTYECHPSELVGPGFKRLLRAALRGFPGQALISRADKGAWGPDRRPNQIWMTTVPQSVERVVSPNWPPTGRSIAATDARGLAELVQVAQNLAAMPR